MCWHFDPVVLAGWCRKLVVVAAKSCYCPGDMRWVRDTGFEGAAKMEHG